MSTEKQDLEVAVPWHPLVVDHGFYSPLMSGSIDGTDSTPHDKAIRRALEASCRVYGHIPYRVNLAKEGGKLTIGNIADHAAFQYLSHAIHCKPDYKLKY